MDIPAGEELIFDPPSPGRLSSQLLEILEKGLKVDGLVSASAMGSNGAYAKF